jgi:hypothetical protein
VTVTVDGVWNGTRVDYAHTFGNSCIRSSSSGVLFDF